MITNSKHQSKFTINTTNSNYINSLTKLTSTFSQTIRNSLTETKLIISLNINPIMATIPTITPKVIMIMKKDFRKMILSVILVIWTVTLVIKLNGLLVLKDKPNINNVVIEIFSRTLVISSVSSSISIITSLIRLLPIWIIIKKLLRHSNVGWRRKFVSKTRKILLKDGLFGETKMPKSDNSRSFWRNFQEISSKIIFWSTCLTVNFKI